MEPLKKGDLKARMAKLAEIDPTARAYSLIEEFKNFAFKGNVIDLAVGVIIGAAFSKIIDSLVRNIIMPLVGLMLPGDQGYVGWKFVVRGQEVPYGLFLGEVVNFLIVAVVLFFFIVKFLGWLTRYRKDEATEAPKLTPDQELLTEIRDLLKAQGGSAASR